MNHKVIVLALSVWCIYCGYNKLPIIPSFGNTQVVVYAEEKFPDAPSKEYQEILEPLSEILKGEPEDAWEFAITYRSWGTFIGTCKLTNAIEFTEAYKEAVISEFGHTMIKGKYKGQLDKVLNELFQQASNNLKDSEGAIKVGMDKEVRDTLTEFLNAASWKFHQVFLENIEDAKS